MIYGKQKHEAQSLKDLKQNKTKKFFEDKWLCDISRQRERYRIAIYRRGFVTSWVINDDDDDDHISFLLLL